MENFFGHLKEETLRHFKQTTFKQISSLTNTFTFTTMSDTIENKTDTF